MSQFLIAVSILLAVVLSSCAPKRASVVMNTEATPSGTLLRLVEEQGSKTLSLVGRGIVTFDSPELAGSASFESNMKKPDSLLVTLEGPFGIDVGTLFLSKDRYVLYNSLENSVSTGVPSTAALRTVIPFDLTYDQLLSAFAGVFVVPDTRSELLQYAVEDEMFVLIFSCGTLRCTYWIDPRYLLVTRFEQRDEKNDILVDARAHAFTQQGDAIAARRVQITFPSQRRQISVAYNSMSINSSETDFRYSIPSNARQRIP